MSTTLSPKTLDLNPPAARFDVDEQTGGTINNVGGDQYNEHRYELVIEPMRRRARALLRLGNSLVLAALAAQLTVLLLFGSRVGDFIDSVGPAIDARSTDSIDWPPFEVLLAIPLAAVVGFVGLVLVLASVSMRRRARREAEAL